VRDDLAQTEIGKGRNAVKIGGESAPSDFRSRHDAGAASYLKSSTRLASPLFVDVIYSFKTYQFTRRSLVSEGKKSADWEGVAAPVRALRCAAGIPSAGVKK
jgi:hypothetical protein